MTGDGCRVAGEVAVLAERVNVTRLQIRRGGLLAAVLSGVQVDMLLVVGPDDLEGVTEFQGCRVWRVEHWPGDPVLAVPSGHSVASAYQVARVLQDQGVRGDLVRAFGPPGWEHVSIPLRGGRHGERVDFVPVTKMTGPMIGVELT